MMSSLNDSVVLVNYFCHKCEKEFYLFVKDNACPHCHSDFIEELANGDTLGLTGAEGGEALDGVHVAADQCSICLDDIESPRKVLKCKHIYHKKCINDWLHNSNSCPLCRKAVDLSTILTPNFRRRLSHTLLRPRFAVDANDMRVQYNFRLALSPRDVDSDVFLDTISSPEATPVVNQRPEVAPENSLVPDVEPLIPRPLEWMRGARTRSTGAAVREQSAYRFVLDNELHRRIIEHSRGRRERRREGMSAAIESTSATTSATTGAHLLD